MKTRRKIYLYLGIALVVLNVLVDIVEISDGREFNQGTAFSIGYFIGSHILLIFGLVFLRLAARLQKKIKAKEMHNMIEDIGKS